MPEITEQREPKLRFTARTRTVDEYIAAGFTPKTNTVNGRPYFPDVPCHVNSTMASLFAGLTITWEVGTEAELQDPTTVLLPVGTFPSLLDVDAFSQCVWCVAMVTDIQIPKKEAPPCLDRPFTVHPGKTLGDDQAARINAMAGEFVTAWNKMAAASLEGYSNLLPQLTPSDPGVQALCTNADHANQWMRETFEFDDLLRCFVTFQLSDDDILKTNEPLRLLWHTYLSVWLTDGGFDPRTVQLSANLIKNQKGQDMRLTKALAKVVPEKVPDAALGFAQRVAFARKPPNRDSMLALMSTALTGTSGFWLTSNPADFATASWGGGFTSCHGPGREHFAGNLKLAQTTNVMMAFVGTPTHKTGRMWIWFDRASKNIWQLKTYGIFPTHLRQPVREYLEHCLQPDHPWRHRGPVSVAVHGQNGQGYFDACHIDQAYATRQRSELAVDATYHLACVKCGATSSVHNRSGACSSCENSSVSRCQNCDAIVAEDDLLHFDDGHYCRGCCYYCDDCDEYFPPEAEGTHVANGNWYCDYHLHRSFFHCERCDEYRLRDNRVPVDGDQLCDDCYTSACAHGDIRTCACGVAHYVDRLTAIEGEWYCTACSPATPSAATTAATIDNAAVYTTTTTILYSRS